MRARILALWCGVLFLLADTSACTAPATGNTARADAGSSAAAPRTFDLYLGEYNVATVSEARTSRGLRRTTTLKGQAGDSSTLAIDLDAQGFVTGARYDREGPKGTRRLVLVQRTLTDVVTKQTAKWPGSEPIVTFESLHRVQAQAPRTVRLVDVASAESAVVTLVATEHNVSVVDAAGQVIASARRATGLREGPGVFAEQVAPTPRTVYPIKPPALRPGPMCLSSSLPLPALALDGPGQKSGRAGDMACVRFETKATLRDAPRPRHRGPEIFLEADAAEVKAFAAAHRKGNALADAAALAEAIHAKLDTGGGGGAPSAQNTLKRWAGDCDDATALVVASLRALGHAARPVVGYLLHEGRYAPHAWAEVFVGPNAPGGAVVAGEWLMVDALAPGVGRLEGHLRLYEGLGGSLSMGRWLGAWVPQAPPSEVTWSGTVSSVPKPASPRKAKR